MYFISFYIEATHFTAESKLKHILYNSDSNRHARTNIQTHYSSFRLFSLQLAQISSNEFHFDSTHKTSSYAMIHAIYVKSTAFDSFGYFSFFLSHR